jgi:hypothetical protein
MSLVGQQQLARACGWPSRLAGGVGGGPVARRRSDEEHEAQAEVTQILPRLCGGAGAGWPGGVLCNMEHYPHQWLPRTQRGWTMFVAVACPTCGEDPAETRNGPERQGQAGEC